MCASCKTKLEAHLRVTHQVAVLVAVVGNGDSWKAARARLVGGLDDKRHVRFVAYLEVKAGMPSPGPLDKFQNGLHAATSATSASVTGSSSSSATGGSKAARMTAAVC